MEEKKLTDEAVAGNVITDEEVIKALRFKAEHDAKIAYLDGCAYKIIRVADVISYIERLQQICNEYAILIDDGELVSKDWHDEQVLQLQAENAGLKQRGESVINSLHETIDKQKAEIERLTEEINQRRNMMQRMDCNYATELQKNAELQRQVDELKQKIKFEHEFGDIKIAQALADFKEWKKQAVKDMAKEILRELEIFKQCAKDRCNPADKIGADIAIKIVKQIAKDKGVEVE